MVFVSVWVTSLSITPSRSIHVVANGIFIAALYSIVYTYTPETLIWTNISTLCSLQCYLQLDKAWKQPKCSSVDEWIKQLQDIYTMEYYSAVEKKISPFVTVWMDLENIMLNEVSQSEKDKYCMLSLTCGTW